MSVDISTEVFFFFQAEDGIRDLTVTGVQTCALPISAALLPLAGERPRAEPRDRARRLVESGAHARRRAPLSHAPRGRERSRRCREAGRPGHAAAVGAHADRAGAARRGGQSDEGGAATRHFARHAPIPLEEIRAQWVITPTIG